MNWGELGKGLGAGRLLNVQKEKNGFKLGNVDERLKIQSRDVVTRV